MRYSLRPLAIALIPVFVLQGCATQNAKGEKLSLGESLKQTFDSEDPCSNSKRNIGILLGTAIGVGIAVASGDGKAGTIAVGAGLGALAGGLIGSELDSRQCELYKIQQKYSLDMQVTPIAIDKADGITTQVANSPSGNDASVAKVASPQQVGLSVSLVDQEDKPQFLPNSDELQPEAKIHFEEIAKQYSPDHLALQVKAESVEQKNKLSNELRKKRILLIGHTDDVGNSKSNAELSEKRAKAVAKVFKSEGISDVQLYYQGAGETLPIADNATPEGRAKNRRVEIVDLADESSFKLYLQNKRAKTEYYRSSGAATNDKQSESKADTSRPNIVSASVGRKTTKATSIRKSDQSDSNTSKQEVNNQRWIDFGGTPVSLVGGKVSFNEKKSSNPKFQLISSAQASELDNISSCYTDRPRDSGAVKSLKDGRDYATSDYMPGVYDSSWSGDVNGHLVALTHMAVLRDGNGLARKPELLIYKDYKIGSKVKPNYRSIPDVNVYMGSAEILYRVFDKTSVRCIDIVIPENNPREAPNSVLVYEQGDGLYSAKYSPKLAK